MILTCASCATRYYADEASVPPQGRTVRCAACGHSWRVERELVLDNAPGPSPATFVDDPPLTRDQIERARRAASPPPTSTQQARARQIQRQQLERLRTAVVAWGVTGGAMAVLLILAVVFRQGVAHVWPNAASAYAAVGLSVNITGLEFSDLSIQRDLEGEAPRITVSGAVRNIAGTPKAPPVLRFSLRDHNSEEVSRWLHPIDGPLIPPGEARSFQTVFANPPVAAVDLEAAFATGREAKKTHAAAPAHKPSPQSAHGEARSADGHAAPEARGAGAGLEHETAG